MAINKYVGIETEFGISVIGRPDFNPVLASSIVVNTYAAQQGKTAWDYEDEDPLRDARGFSQKPELTDHSADPVEDQGLANAILHNGARFYVDHAHPEYSAPECTNPYDAMVWDKAGERILEWASKEAVQALPPATAGQPIPERILITKNNTDGKGSAYGTHENFLVDRAVPFGQLVRQLTPFLVTRQVLVGAGRIGNEFGLKDVPYQIAQRSDFFEVEVGLETTLKRPIVNTRDEPHADPEKYRRLHLIIGDANMSEVCTYLKVGSASLVLMMIEDGYLPESPELRRPVSALHAISHDLTCRNTVELADGTRVTPLDIQRHYLDHARRYVFEHGPAWGHDVLRVWEETLAALERDPMELDGVVDWVTKYQLLRRYLDRDGVDWDSDKLKMIDVQYHDVRRDRGLYYRLLSRGKITTMASDAEVTHAVNNPPHDTRAYFRGRCIKKYADEIAAAGWDSIIFDVGSETLQRVPMMEPGRGSRDVTGRLIDASPTAKDLLEALQQ